MVENYGGEPVFPDDGEPEAGVIPFAGGVPDEVCVVAGAVG